MNKRIVKSIKFDNDHKLANMAALYHILGLKLEKVRELLKLTPGTVHELEPSLQINSDSSSDRIHEQLSQYDIVITIKVIN